MIVGIDIDGTINDLHSVILEYGRLYNQTIVNGTIKDENAYYIKDIFDWNVLDYDKFKWIVQSDLVNRIKSRNGVASSLIKLKEHGYKIYIITGRKKNEMNDRNVETKQWLDNNMIPYDKLIFEENDKGVACYKNGVDIYVDDSIKHLDKVNRYGVKCYLFDNIYNRNDSYYERVCSFEELCDKIIIGGEL